MADTRCTPPCDPNAAVDIPGAVAAAPPSAAPPSPFVIVVNPPSPAPAATRVVRRQVAPNSIRVYRMDCRGHARCVQINHR